MLVHLDLNSFLPSATHRFFQHGMKISLFKMFTGKNSQVFTRSLGQFMKKKKKERKHSMEIQNTHLK